MDITTVIELDMTELDEVFGGQQSAVCTVSADGVCPGCEEN